MIDISKLCMICLSEKDDNGVCPNCRKDTDVVQQSPLLPVKTIIAQRYVIAQCNKRNCEGITYSAFDLKLNKPCSLREFFPESLVKRDEDEISVIIPPENKSDFSQYLNAFVSLWIKLQRLKGLTALITVTEVFHCNNTAYAVYDESERITLRDYLLETQEGFIPWEKSRIMFMPVLSTLGTLHTSGVIHKGINPTSFIFSKEGKLKLTDFCITPARVSAGLPDPEVFDGFAPIEQYSRTASLDQRSDIYSFCSVLYRALIGTTPINAKLRAQNDQMMIPAKFAEQLPPYVINALINGMAILPDERTENIEQLRSDLSASQRVIGASAPVYKPTVTINNTIPSQPTRPLSTVNKVQPNATRQNNSGVAGGNNSSSANAQRMKIAREKLETEKKNKKKNALIAMLCVVLAMLLVGIGILAKELVVTLNKTPEETTVADTILFDIPNFLGSNISDVISNRQYTDFLKIETSQQSSPTVMAGLVIAQSIPQGATAKKGDTIILTVSTGPKSIQLPDVTGKTYEQAEKELNALGIKCTKSYFHNDGTFVGETVKETTPAALSTVKEGTIVTVIVYTPIEETTNSVENTTNSNGNAVEQFLQSFTTQPAQPTQPAQNQPAQYIPQQ